MSRGQNQTPKGQSWELCVNYTQELTFNQGTTIIYMTGFQKCFGWGTPNYAYHPSPSASCFEWGMLYRIILNLTQYCIFCRRGSGQIILFSLTNWEKLEKLYLSNYIWEASTHRKPIWMRFWTMSWYYKWDETCGGFERESEYSACGYCVSSLQWFPISWHPQPCVVPPTFTRLGLYDQ